MCYWLCSTFFITLAYARAYCISRGGTYCVDNCSTSSYQQICCNPKYLGAGTVVTSAADGVAAVFCPPTLPSGCSTKNQFKSCKQLLQANPTATSGYYEISVDDETVISVFCEMTGANCDDEGGWTRIAHVNMTEPGASWPKGLMLQEYSSIGHGLCGRQGKGCQSIHFTTNQAKYSKVCGQVRGYQYRLIDAFNGDKNIDTDYVEGVSITHGNPRQHIWTYVAGDSEYESTDDDCPCNVNGTEIVPSFVGNDYYCESSSSNTYLIDSDPLWDGKQCNGLERPCCSTPKMPFFTKLVQESSDDIELRICASAHPASEESPIDIIEMFIK